MDSDVNYITIRKKKAYNLFNWMFDKMIDLIFPHPFLLLVILLPPPPPLPPPSTIMIVIDGGSSSPSLKQDVLGGLFRTTIVVLKRTSNYTSGQRSMLKPRGVLYNVTSGLGCEVMPAFCSSFHQKLIASVLIFF